MEFRLIYDGQLLSEKCKDKGNFDVGAVGRATEKHRLRKRFHLQLRELWKMDPGLREQSEKYFKRYTTPQNLAGYPGPGVVQIEPALPLMSQGLEPGWTGSLEIMSESTAISLFRS